MPDQKHIKDAYERVQNAIRSRPSVARGTQVTKVRVRNNMTCDIEDGEFTLVADEVQDLGGDNEGPNSGAYARAALGSCLAVGYAMSAAVLGVDISAIEVDISTDYDARGMFGVDDSVPPGWGEVKYEVRIESTSSEADVMRAIGHAERHSSILDVFSRPVSMSRTVQIRQPGG